MGTTLVRGGAHFVVGQMVQIWFVRNKVMLDSPRTLITRF